MNDNYSNLQSNLSIMDSLVQLSFLVHAILNRVGAEHDVSIIQIRLFGILRDRELSMLQLAEYLNLDKSSITGLINRAERRGLVERTNSLYDRRVINVRVTPEGQKIIQVASSEIERQIKTVTGTLSEYERSQFIALASKILGYL
ncbi:MarR family winged helix-turn-helix transcriptional regulator [Paenibacillus radicis (ex Xue et al. 2023)]|uniref:MarR family transcriptional regulator n=1 Tax=Paenibacillus radicis (ex Xue et al. 2023) TaxID=2972489 RepID=A0ABT1YG51_9BACL|nr:MarR family transcriptional regulator [Paenibacillus radicis (ex Xue et al. 2023)]MCR8632177.1 MarR family transcriptional regulator [Paenibacillus radicis (ex Xue et al. 2023)]